MYSEGILIICTMDYHDFYTGKLAWSHYIVYIIIITCWSIMARKWYSDEEVCQKFVWKVMEARHACAMKRRRTGRAWEGQSTAWERRYLNMQQCPQRYPCKSAANTYGGESKISEKRETNKFTSTLYHATRHGKETCKGTRNCNSNRQEDGDQDVVKNGKKNEDNNQYARNSANNVQTSKHGQ